MKQTLGYMAQCGAEEGHLVVTDRRNECAEDRQDGDGGADGDGRRRNVRGMAVWMLQGLGSVRIVEQQISALKQYPSHPAWPAPTTP